MENLITWLERQIELCDDLKSMEKEKWAFIQTLKKVRKEAINYSHCCKSDSELLPTKDDVYSEIKRLTDLYYNDDNIRKSALENVV